MAESSGAGDLANTLLPSLIAGKDFSFPEINISSDMFSQPKGTGDLYAKIEPLTLDDLTTGQVNGNGVFDKLMTSLVNHLKVEYEAARISGAEYTKAYIGVVGAALQTAQQFLLTKDQAYWGALLVQQQAKAAEVESIRARVELETARVSLVRGQYEAALAEATYALTKIKLATEDAAYATQVAQTAKVEADTIHTTKQTDHVTEQIVGLEYTNTNLLPAQLADVQASTAATNASKLMTDAQTAGQLFTNSNLLPAQLARTSAETSGITYTNTNILPAQKIGIERTNANLQSQGIGIDFTNENILPQQEALLKEQTEVQRAQTADVRLDGVAVLGVLGKQKDLYTQQITSYQRDAETKAAKMWVDSWITQKTIDEGLLAPSQFNNTNLDAVLSALRSNLSLS